jgi:hypothetical protein
MILRQGNEQGTWGKKQLFLPIRWPHRGAKQGYVDPAVAQVPAKIVDLTFAKFKHDAGQFALKTMQDLREFPAEQCRWNIPNCKMAELTAGSHPRAERCFLMHRDEPGCALPVSLAGGGEIDAALAPVEQFEPEGLFECADLLAERWLRYSDPFGSARHVKSFRHNEELA